MKLIEAIEKRRSIRKFKKKQVRWADVLESIDAALKAPLAGNLNTLRCIIVTDQDLKQKLADHADQDWMATADTILAICSEETRLIKMYDKRGENYAKQQIGAAIQNCLLCLTDLGIGACWVGAYLNSAVQRDLKIPANVNVEALIPLGYPNEKPKAQRKDALENVIFWEKWGERKRSTVTEDPKTW